MDFIFSEYSIDELIALRNDIEHELVARFEHNKTLIEKTVNSIDRALEEIMEYVYNE